MERNRVDFPTSFARCQDVDTGPEAFDVRGAREASDPLHAERLDQHQAASLFWPAPART